MLHFKKNILAFFIFLLMSSSYAHAQQERTLDSIVAIVNNHIILKSDVDNRVSEYMQSAGINQFSERLWFDILESAIDHYVLVEQARIDSVIVSDDEVNRAMDQRIRQLVQQVGSEQELERIFGKSIVQLRAEFRSMFRDEIRVQRVREKKMRSITITRPEVVEFFNSIPADSLPMIPETVELGQIVVIPPARQEARTAAFNLASALRDSLINHGANFEALARRHSHGPGAANGGLIPLMPLTDLVAEYSAAAAALEPGGISEVVETRFGFHVIRLNRRVGDQIETNHILIQIREDELDEEFAINKLNALRDSVLVHGKDFRDLARRHSDDRSTAVQGGRIINPNTGQRRIAVDDLDPALYRLVLNLNSESDISTPSRFTTGPANNRRQAYRIVKLFKRVEAHVANLEQDYDLIRNFALQQKQLEVLSKWMLELRDDIYVEYRIDSPYAHNL